MSRRAEPVVRKWCLVAENYSCILAAAFPVQNTKHVDVGTCRDQQRLCYRLKLLLSRPTWFWNQYAPAKRISQKPQRFQVVTS